MSRTKEEAKRIKDNNEKIDRIFIGNGRIWEPENSMTPITEADEDGLPF